MWIGKLCHINRRGCLFLRHSVYTVSKIGARQSAAERRSYHITAIAQLSWAVLAVASCLLSVQDEAVNAHNELTFKSFVFLGCWSQIENIRSVFGGPQPNINSVSACQSACLSDTSCVAIDYDQWNRYRQYCWIVYSRIWIVRARGVTHYILNRQQCSSRLDNLVTYYLDKICFVLHCTVWSKYVKRSTFNLFHTLLPPLGQIWDVILVWNKGNIKKNVSVLQYFVYYYNGAQRYEQFLQVCRLCRALMLLGLALCLPSACVSFVSWCYIDILTNHCPSVLWRCWFGHLTRKIVSEMTYNVSSGTLNPTIPPHKCS